MTVKQFVDSKGNTWEWEDTPELEAFRKAQTNKRLHKPEKKA
jgi:hypothetical protein